MSKARTIPQPEAAVVADSGTGRQEAAKPFVFGTEPTRPLGAIPGLDRMSERAARKLRLRIEPISRIKPLVAAEPVVVRRFDSWKAEQPEFTSIALYRFRPLKGGLLVTIQPELVRRPDRKGVV